MANNKKHSKRQLVVSTSNPISSAILNIDLPTVSSSADGVLFYISHKGLYDYVQTMRSKVDEDMKREHFYITAIRNLRKRIRFMNLHFEFQNDDITEDEFDRELKENEEKYFVQVSLLKNEADLVLIKDIVEKINDDLTVDDISDIFSIDISTNQNLIPSSL